MPLALQCITDAGHAKDILLTPGQYVIGRDPDCHIPLAISALSRRHCLMKVTDTGASVVDLGSRNGTVVNSKRIQGEQVLQDGDRLHLSSAEYVVRICSQVEYSGKDLVIIKPGQG